MSMTVHDVRKRQIEVYLSDLLEELVVEGRVDSPLAYQVSAALAGLNLQADGTVGFENYRKAVTEGPIKPDLKIVH